MDLSSLDESQLNQQANQILLKTADFFEHSDHWTKGSYYRRIDKQSCTFCAHGAIAYFADDKIKKEIDEDVGMGRVLRTAIVIEHQLYNILMTPQSVAHLKAKAIGLTTNYNDQPTTTKSDVIQLLRKAAQVAFKPYNHEHPSINPGLSSQS